MNNPKEIAALGRNLRTLREKSGMSQQQLADVAGITKITVQRIENAKFSASIDTLISIAEGLQIPLRKLVEF